MSRDLDKLIARLNKAGELMQAEIVGLRALIQWDADAEMGDRVEISVDTFATINSKLDMIEHLAGEFWCERGEGCD